MDSEDGLGPKILSESPKKILQKEFLYKAMVMIWSLCIHDCLKVFQYGQIKRLGPGLPNQYLLGRYNGVEYPCLPKLVLKIPLIPT